MKESEHGRAERLRFRDIIIVSAIALVVCISDIVSTKLIWGKQVTWTELLILFPVFTAFAVVAGYYLMKKDEKEK